MVFVTLFARHTTRRQHLFVGLIVFVRFRNGFKKTGYKFEVFGEDEKGLKSFDLDKRSFVS